MCIMMRMVAGYLIAAGVELVEELWIGGWESVAQDFGWFSLVVCLVRL